MQATEFSWQTRDGLKVHALHWAVENPRAVVALVHGLGDHCGRYDNLATYFNEKQVAVLAFDQLGHGKTEGRRGFAPSTDLLLDEISYLLSEAYFRYPHKPVFLYGHSMGGNLVLTHALRRSAQLRGVIASAPWIRLAFQPPAWRVWLGRLVRNVLPALRQPNNLNPKHICRDPEVVEAYENDPLVHDFITPALGVGMLEQAAWLDQYQGAFRVPLLLMHGTGDRITSAEATEAFAGRVEGAVEFKDWEGFYHEIHHEKEQQEVFDYTLRWMEQWL